MSDETMHVACSNDGCDRTTELPTSVSGGLGDDLTPNDWEVTMTMRGGSLYVVEANCHGHRVDKAIDRLVHETTKLDKQIGRSIEAASRVVEDTA